MGKNIPMLYMWRTLVDGTDICDAVGVVGWTSRGGESTVVTSLVQQRHTLQARYGPARYRQQVSQLVSSFFIIISVRHSGVTVYIHFGPWSLRS